MRQRITMAALAAVVTLAVGCIDSSLSLKVSDVPGDSAADSAESKADVAAAELVEDLTADAPANTDLTADELSPAEVLSGKNCYEAITCLTEYKEWTPGAALPETPCLEGIEEEEMIQVDGVNDCMHQECNDELEAWKVGGAGEESILYLCLIEKCSNPSSVCIGGQGEDTCADALKCMALCQPLDEECTVPCLVETSDYQSEKTGKFLECLFASCALSELGNCYEVQTTCAMQFCLELAGS